MFAKLQKIKQLTQKYDNLSYFALLSFCAILPFQFALNPAAGFDLAIMRLFIPLLLIYWITYSWIKNEIIFNKTKISYLIILFLILATASLWNSQNITWSLRKLAFLFSIFPIYFITTALINNQTRRLLILKSLTISASILAIFAIMQFFAQFIFGIDPVYNFLAKIMPFFLGKSFSGAVLAYPSWLVNADGVTYMRAVGIFPDPHMLSYYFGMLIPWSIALAYSKTKYSKIFFLATALLIVGDICTFTRGGYLALIAGAIVILPLVSKKTIKKILLSTATLILLFLMAPHSPVAGRLSSSFDVQEGSNQARITNWQQALPIIIKHPLGVGIGMYAITVKPTADYREPIYAHNLYFDIAAELGIPALLIFIAIILLVIKYFWLASRKNTFFLAGVSSITIFAIHSLVETPLYSVHILSLFCIIIAMAPLMKKYE
jgi:putative inorganic carbon (HCO3(-)) transporter